MKTKPTEFAINSFASMMCIFQPGDFQYIDSTAFNVDRPCHIYVIASRPRIGVIKDSLTSDDDSISLSFKIWQQDTYCERIVKLRNDFVPKGPVSIETKYPFTSFTLSSGENSMMAKSALLLSQLRPRSVEDIYLDLQVLYVGQSYGTDGSRTAPERLEKHETLQAVYGEASRDFPDREIWIMLFSFEQMGIAKFDGVTSFSDSDRKGDKERALKFFNTVWTGGIAEKQFICFTEAAMIRYFQPKYNDHFKYNFPNPAHTSYSECYDLDVNSVNVELGTFDAIKEKLYSDSIPSRSIHFATFALHDAQERRSMFDFI